MAYKAFSLELTKEAQRRILSDTEAVRNDAKYMDQVRARQRAMYAEADGLLHRAARHPNGFVNELQKSCADQAKP